MALSNFFSINLPYGISKNEHNQWFAFNREYVPIGWTSTEKQESIYKKNVYGKFPLYATYKGLTEKKLLAIAGSEELVTRNEEGEIVRIFLYGDRTNPLLNNATWKAYISKLNTLSKLVLK